MQHQQANNDANRNKEVGKREAGLEVGKHGPLSCFSRVYLVIVVVRQALAVESHPPPLENAFPAIEEE